MAEETKLFSEDDLLALKNKSAEPLVPTNRAAGEAFSDKDLLALKAVPKTAPKVQEGPLVGDAAIDAILKGDGDLSRVDKQLMLAALEPRLYGMKEEDQAKLIGYLDSKQAEAPSKGAWQTTKDIASGFGHWAVNLLSSPKALAEAGIDRATADNLISHFGNKTDAIKPEEYADLAKYAKGEPADKDYSSYSTMLKIGEFGQPGTEEASKHRVMAILDAVANKARAVGEDKLTPAEKGVLYIAQKSEEADAKKEAILNGLTSGVAGVENQVVRGIANNLVSDRTRLRILASQAAQEARDQEDHKGYSSAKETFEKAQALGSLADPGAHLIGHGASAVGEAALAPTLAKVGTLAADADLGVAGGQSLVKSVGKAISHSSNAAERGVGAAGAVLKAVPGAANAALNVGGRIVEAMPKEIAAAAGESLAFGGLAKLAGDDDVAAMAGGPLMGRAVFGLASALPKAGFALSKARMPVGEGAGLADLSPTGFHDIDAARGDAYHSASGRDRAVIEALDKVQQMHNAKTDGPLMNQLVFKTPEQVAEFVSKLNEHFGREVASFDPKSASGFSVSEPLPADAFGNKSLKGKQMVVSATYTDAPNFRQAAAEEAAHTLVKGLPEEVLKAIDSFRTEEATAKLRDAGVPEQAIPEEFATQHVSDWIDSQDFRKTSGGRQALVSFFAKLGGAATKDSIGTYGLQADRGVSKVLFSHAKAEPHGVLSSSLVGDTSVDSTRFSDPSKAGRKLSADELGREAALSGGKNPETSIAAEAVGKLPASKDPAGLKAKIEEVAAARGVKMSPDQITRAVDRGREMLGGVSASAEKSAVTKAALEASAVSKRLDTLIRNSKLDGVEISAEAVAKLLSTDAELKPEVIEAAQAKVREANAQIAKANAASQAAIDKAAGREDSRRYDAWNNQLKRNAELDKAEAKKAEKWNAGLEKQRADNAKAEAAKAIEDAKPEELKALEAAKGDLKALGVTPTLAGQINNHLKANLLAVLSADSSPVSRVADDAVSGLRPDMTPAEKRSVVLAAISKVRESIIGEQGLDVLTSPEVAKHPSASEAQWDAVVKYRGAATLADVSNSAAIKAVIQATERKNATLISETGKSGFDTDLISDEGKVSAPKKSSSSIPAYEESPEFKPIEPGAEAVPEVNAVLKAKIFSKAEGAGFDTERRPWSEDASKVRKAVAESEGISQDQLNSSLTTKEILEKGKRLPEVKELASGLLASGADRDHTVVVLDSALPSGVVPVFDLTQFAANFNTLLAELPSSGKTALKKALARLAPSWDGGKVTDAVAKEVYARIADAYSSSGRTLSGVDVVGGVPSPHEVGVGVLSREESFIVHAAFGGAWGAGGAEAGNISPKASSKAKAVTQAIREVDRSPSRVSSLGDLSAGFHDEYASPQALASELRLENTFHTFSKAELAREAKAVGAVGYANTGTNTVVKPGVGTFHGLRTFHAGVEKQGLAKASELGGIGAVAGAASVRQQKSLPADNIAPKK